MTIEPPLALNCPRCGRPMETVETTEAGGRAHVYRCREHGYFHFSERTALTPGKPD